ncbi:MAG: hypothetical protein JWR27_1368 [Aeromicrobium sp.]|nr:hypothetical protein [Aeromicrobium sp.]
MRRWRTSVLPLWCAALAIVIGAPWLRGGYLLSYDMVWVPRLDLDRPEVWGLGTGLPRAVPSDAVVGLLGAALPAVLVQRLVLLIALFVLGLGMARLLRHRSVAAQLAAATMGIWNPYVAERLVLGQWPVLVALAGLPWLVRAFVEDDAPRWSIAVLALAATALSPATGVMGVVMGVAAAWRHGAVRLLLLAALVNGPWIVSGLHHVDIARTDPAAAALFDLQGEGSLGKLGSALTLGGVWNTDVVPTSRTLLTAAVLAVLLGAVMIVGLVAMWFDDRRLLSALAVPGGVGLVVALGGWLAPDLVARVVEDVPAGGIVRDGTRWLALLVPLEAVALGVGACAVARRLRHTSWASALPVLAIVLPLAALPDLAFGVGARVEPTTYPTSWAAARETIEKSSVPGDILVLPFTAYRRPTWNDDTPVLDPAGRYFDRTTVTNDALDVSGRTIAGEDPRAARIGRDLAGDDDVLARLARRGIGIVVVETDALDAERFLRRLRGARELQVAGDGLRVFAIPDAQAQPVDAGDRRIMIATWSVAGLTLLLALAGVVRRRIERIRSSRLPERMSPATRD